MSSTGATKPRPEMVGAALVHQYYSVLYESPDRHKIYQDSSILSHPDSSGLMISVKIKQAFHDKLWSLDFSKFTTEIQSVNSQASYKDGVLVVVTGIVTERNNVRHHFTQSFFLAQQERGLYVVLNDTFRFVHHCLPRAASQVSVNGTNAAAPAAALITKPENVLVYKPLVPRFIEHDGNEFFNRPENSASEVEDCDAADSEDVGRRKFYALIVKASQGSLTTTPISIPVSKPKAALLNRAPQKPVSANSEWQPGPSPKAYSTSEAPVPINSTPNGNSNDVEGHSLYIRSLPLSTTTELVEEEFNKFGPIRPGAVLARNHKIERSYLGCVEYESMDSLLVAIKASPLTIGGPHMEESRIRTRVANGVVTTGGNVGGRGQHQLGRDGNWNDNFRGHGGFSGGNQGYVRTEFRSRGECSGR